MGAPYPLARMLPAGKEAIHWQLSCWSKRYSSKQRREPSSPCSVSSPLHPSIFWQSIVPSGKGETCHRAKKGGFGPKEQQIANWHNGCICIYVSKWLKNHLCSTYIRALKYQSKSYLRGTENLFLMISLRHWLFISIAPFVHSGAQFQISPQRLDSYILLAWDSGVGTELTSVLIIIHFWPRLCLISCTYEPESAVYFPWIPHSIWLRVLWNFFKNWIGSKKRVIKLQSLELDRPEFRFQIFHLSFAWPWVHYLIFLKTQFSQVYKTYLIWLLWGLNETAYKKFNMAHNKSSINGSSY